MIYGTVLCLGDSLITGARDEFGLSVARILGDDLSVDDQMWIAVDEGVNGETSGDLLRRAYRVVRSYPEARDVVLCVGMNDAKTPGLPSDIFRRNYEELLRTLAILGKHCYACLIPPRDGFGAPDYIENRFLERYNQIIEELATRDSHSVSVVDLTSIPSRLRADGVHFNFGGDTWAAKKIAAAIMSARS